MTSPTAVRGPVDEVLPERWDDLLERLGVADVYLQRDYVEAASLLDAGRPAFLHADGVAFAAIVRGVPGADGVQDVTTPYGYGGPAGPGDVGRFYASYEAWCAANRVVTTFIRFHPLLENHLLAPASLRRERLADTATWPLAGDDDLRTSMHEMHRRGVGKARRAGVRTTVERRPARLDDFAALYEAAMRRRDASEFYFFPPAYWDALAGPLADRLVRLDARLEGELVASQLLLASRPWLHYHLGAATDAGFAVGASKLLFLEAARWGRDHGFVELHLGSGLGGREDSLWDFKQRFSPAPGREFWIGKLVHDADAYRELAGGAVPDGFFPAYRAPAR
jgi:serine/alanine adding enzyme